MRAVLLFGSIALAPSLAHAQMAPEAIASIAATTRSMCLSGSQYVLDVNGDGSLSLLKRGVDGKVVITQSTGTGGALNYRDEGKRIDADKNIIGCISQNLPVLLTAAGAKLPAPPPKTCRIAENGIERAARVFSTQRESPGMGRGHNRKEWCDTAIAQLAREQPAEASFKVLGDDEYTTNHCSPFNCPQYHYKCNIEVSIPELYKEAASPHCP